MNCMWKHIALSILTFPSAQQMNNLWIWQFNEMIQFIFKLLAYHERRSSQFSFHTVSYKSILQYLFIFFITKNFSVSYWNCMRYQHKVVELRGSTNFTNKNLKNKNTIFICFSHTPIEESKEEVKRKLIVQLVASNCYQLCHLATHHTFQICFFICNFLLFIIFFADVYHMQSQ